MTACQHLLRVSARLVPHDIRADWLREWDAELQYAAARAARRGEAVAVLRVRLFIRCTGAMVHAAWLRWDRWRIELLLQDLRYALRTLSRQPAFAAIVVLTLAVGIGANVAIFSAVRAVMLKPLPYPQPDRLVRLFKFYNDRPSGWGGAVSPPDFAGWRQATRTLSFVAAVAPGSYTVSGDDRAAEQIPGADVTGDFFDVLGVRPLQGRVLTGEDDVEGAPQVAVIGYELWQRRWGGDPSLLGRVVDLNSEPARIVGVMARGVAFPLGSEIWVPMRFTARDLETQRGAHYLDVIGRLRPGVPLDAARADLRQVGDRLAREYPSTNRDTTVSVHPVHDVMVGDLRPAMLMLLGAVGFVLLIVCVNVASLVLTRAVGRSREMAVRVALGARRSRLVSLLLGESVILAAIGGVGGLMLAGWIAAAIAALPETLGIPRLDETAVDGAVLALTAVVSMGAAVLFTIIPAWHASRVHNVSERIRAQGPTATGDPGRERLRAGLIVVEIALAVMLLVGAGLLVQSFLRLTSVELGIDPASVHTFNLSLPDAKYDTPEKRAAFVDRYLTRMHALPGVGAAGVIFGLPLSNFRYGITTSTLDGRRLPEEEQDRLTVQVRVASPEYFRALGIPVLRGRPFADGDVRGAEQVVVVSAEAARRYWPGGDALGRHVEIGTRLGQGANRAGGRVVGVAGDVRDFGAAVEPRPTIYLAHAQFPMDFVTVVARTATSPNTIVEPARAALAEIDPDVPLYRVRTMAQLAADAVAQPRLYMLLLIAFAATALLLAALGIYGVLAHAVSQRTREIGIRLALGARRQEVVTLVVRQAVGLAATGLALGLALAAAAAYLMQSLLFEVEPGDPATFATMATLLLAVALVASYVPARRASRTDPVQALRME